MTKIFTFLVASKVIFRSHFVVRVVRTKLTETEKGCSVCRFKIASVKF